MTVKAVQALEGCRHGRAMNKLVLFCCLVLCTKALDLADAALVKEGNCSTKRSFSFFDINFYKYDGIKLCRKLGSCKEDLKESKLNVL